MEKNINKFRNENELIFCKCGCGEIRQKFDKRGRERKFIDGHYGSNMIKGENNPMHGKIPYNKKDISKEELIFLYLNKRMSIRQIANLKCCSDMPIRNNLINLGIEIRGISEANKGRVVSKEWKENIKLGVKRNLPSTIFKNGLIPYNKNKTYEEVFGEEKAKKIKEKQSIPLEQKVGKERAKELMEKQSKERKGKVGKTKGRKYSKELYPNMGLRKTRKNIIFPVKDTSIELKIQNFLRLLKIEYVTHCYMSEIIHAYQCDILIPEQKGIFKKTIIECDGDAFHFNPKKYNKDSKIFKNGMIADERWNLDEARTKKLQEKGYNVIRIWESEIKKMELNCFKEKLCQKN